MTTTEKTTTAVTEITMVNDANQQLILGYVAGDIRIGIGAESYWLAADEVDEFRDNISKLEEAFA